jgi:hypothetical protein
LRPFRPCGNDRAPSKALFVAFQPVAGTLP